MGQINRPRVGRVWDFARCLVGIATFAPSISFAQDDDVKAKTVIEDSFFPSPRAAGMAGALSTVADDVDAIMHNPAGIGGAATSVAAWTKKVYFPLIGFSANENARDLNTRLRAEGGFRDATIGKAIVDAAHGKRQYGRAAAGLGLVFGRTIVLPFTDTQVAAVSQGENGQVDARYRSFSGVAYGMSVADSQGRLALGYSGWYASGRETIRTLTYPEIVDPSRRKEALSEGERAIAGTVHNIGMTMAFRGAVTRRVALRPRVAIAVKHLGKSEFDYGESDADDASTSSIAQDTTLGVSISPPLGKLQSLHWLVEAQKLDQAAVPFHKKIRTGLEYSLGSLDGSNAICALRLGFRSAGVSGGVFLNLGLVGFELSSEAVDIGKDNNRLIQRRNVGTFIVNAASM